VFALPCGRPGPQRSGRPGPLSRLDQGYLPYRQDGICNLSLACGWQGRLFGRHPLDAVREFRKDDIQQVTRLWLRVFHQRDAHPAVALQDYFRELFFESPWADPGLPSLVCEEGARIVGFLGVLPRRMMFRGRPIQAAVATQIMVDGQARGYPAAKLIRRYFAGRQDLSYSDGANGYSERLWSACGGDVARLYSLTWTRLLRPLGYAASILGERVAGAYAYAARALSPVWNTLDAAAARTRPGLRWLPRLPDLSIVEDPPEQTLLWCIQKVARPRALAPSYDADSLRWLVRRAAERKRYGPLYKAVLQDAGGRTAGWYLYHSRPGAVAQVLQFGARPGAAASVLNCLFHQARRQGAIAVSGGMAPDCAKELTDARCSFRWPGCAVVAHSRNNDILAAVHRGDAFLTRLEGEWWARFADPEWTAAAPSPDAAGQAVAARLDMNQLITR
jgi:hypothetical protein